MAIRLAVGLDQASVARLNRELNNAADASTEETMQLAAKAMLVEARKIVRKELPTEQKSGTVKSNGTRPLVDSYHAEAFRSAQRGGSWSARIQPHPKADRAKVASIEGGRKGGYRVIPRKAKRLSGWDYTGPSNGAGGRRWDGQVFAPVAFPKPAKAYRVMGRARDRVYQRIVRGSRILTR